MPWSSRVPLPTASQGLAANGLSSARSEPSVDNLADLLYEVPVLQNIPSTTSLSSDVSRTHSGHGRSSSHPFQPLFGSAKKVDKPELEILSGKLAQDMDSATRTNKNTKEDDFKTGNCLTCDSTVRWPSHLDVYRCTACLMINDLKPAHSQGPTKEAGNRVPRKGKSLIKLCELYSCYTALPLTSERTRELAEQCVVKFLNSRTRFRTSDGSVQRPAADQIGSASSFPPARSMAIPFNVIKSERTPSPGENRPVWKQIFRQLEDLLVSSLIECDCLNSSFILSRPQVVRTANEPLASEKSKRDEPVAEDEQIFEFDAKTLLLGDIGENGQWWTGRVSKSKKEAEPGRKVSRFDWSSIYAWYDVIMSCGKEWRSHCSTLAPEVLQSLAKEENEIDELLTQARFHVQRTFLKAIENLLRRPGRPIQSPEDARFLIILLANPLLYPNQLEEYRSKPGGSANGQHSGIIKRILGMLGNLTTCHQAMISWFCRVSEVQFHDMVELVGGFVSYRLGRQKGRQRNESLDLTAGLIPDLSGPGGASSAQLHAAIGLSRSKERKEKQEKTMVYHDDWQIKVAAKVMSLLFVANSYVRYPRHDPRKGGITRRRKRQLLPTSFFYNTLLDYADLIADFEAWESRRGKFSFCQYPMFLSIWAKIRILEYDAKRQMDIKARDAFFTSILSRKTVNQYLVLRIRRDCLVEDSLTRVSEVVGGGQEEIKKGLRITFVGEEGVDAGG
jgi:E3 ubiquitin-protein ligase HECTD2